MESSRHELRIAHGLTLVTSSLRGWEVFLTPRALMHTRITWALSPTVPQVSGVTPGPPCAHDVWDIPHGDVHDNLNRMCELEDMAI